MRRSIFLSASVLVLVIFSAAANAQKEKFVGAFVAEDPNTRGISRLTLGDDDRVNVWGRCHPTDCDWGTETIFAYAPSVDAHLQSSARAISAIYVKGHATTILVIRPLKDDKLRVDVFTRFTDRSGRTAYTAKFIMVREGSVP